MINIISVCIPSFCDQKQFPAASIVQKGQYMIDVSSKSPRLRAWLYISVWRPRSCLLLHMSYAPIVSFLCDEVGAHPDASLTAPSPERKRQISNPTSRVFSPRPAFLLPIGLYRLRVFLVAGRLLTVWFCSCSLPLVRSTGHFLRTEFLAFPTRLQLVFAVLWSGAALL